MPAVFDCFIFFNENDLMQIRFEELYAVVDHFVIVEADKTFRGNDKPFNFDTERFAKHMDKVIYHRVSMPDFPHDPDAAWHREWHQRDEIKQALVHRTQPDDVILISDADEIPRHSVVRDINTTLGGIASLDLRKFTYGLNVQPDEPNTMPKAVRSRLLYKSTPQQLRYSQPGHVIADAGWEFSSLGTPEQILYKLQNFAHSEFDDAELTVENLRRRMYLGQDILGRD